MYICTSMYIYGVHVTKLIHNIANAETFVILLYEPQAVVVEAGPRAYLKVKPTFYDNSAGRDWWNHGCDPFGSHCDHQFIFCLDTFSR